MTAAEARTEFRERVQETNTTVLPDAQIDRLLQAGQEALNRRIGYYWKDSTVNLVAAQQEYDLPTDFVSAIFVYWNQKFLDKNDPVLWRNEGDNWRVDQGAPSEYAVYGAKLSLRLIPNANAVAQASTLTFRHVATPPSFTTSAFTGLLSQDHRLPVYWAVVEWSSSHPDSGLAAYRAARYTALFESEAAAAAETYSHRSLERSR